MNTEKCRKRISVSTPARAACAGVCISLGLLLSACGADSTALPIPTLSSHVPTETLYISYPILLTPTPTCNDGLVFVADVTIPDYSIVAPGSILDKQWLIRNSGSCNWDGRYRLRLVDGNTLNAPLEQALYPARGGTQATLRIIFTAPLEPGEYFSQWQAFDARGIPFGDSFLIIIVVQ